MRDVIFRQERVLKVKLEISRPCFALITSSFDERSIDRFSAWMPQRPAKGAKGGWISLPVKLPETAAILREEARWLLWFIDFSPSAAGFPLAELRSPHRGSIVGGQWKLGATFEGERFPVSRFVRRWSAARCLIDVSQFRGVIETSTIRLPFHREVTHGRLSCINFLRTSRIFLSQNCNIFSALSIFNPIQPRRNK